MGILLLMTVISGFALGFAVSVSLGFVARIRSRDRSDLLSCRQALVIAENGLRRAANPGNNSQLEATIALTDLDLQQRN